MQTAMIELSARETDGRGFEPLVPCGTHAFQACTIDRSVTHPKSCSRSGAGGSKLQSTEQFVERELQTDVEFAELAVVGADRIETHFVNDGFDLERVLREKRDAPLRVI